MLFSEIIRRSYVRAYLPRCLQTLDRARVYSVSFIRRFLSLKFRPGTESPGASQLPGEVDVKRQKCPGLISGVLSGTCMESVYV